MKNASPVPALNWTAGGLTAAERAVTARIGRSAGGVTVKSTRDTRWVIGPAFLSDSRMSRWLRLPRKMYFDTPSVWWNPEPVGPVAVMPAKPVVRRVTVRSPAVVLGAADQAIDDTLTNRPLVMVILSAGAAVAGTAAPTVTPAAASATMTARIPRIRRFTSAPLDLRGRSYWAARDTAIELSL